MNIFDFDGFNWILASGNGPSTPAWNVIFRVQNCKNVEKTRDSCEWTVQTELKNAINRLNFENRLDTSQGSN